MNNTQKQFHSLQQHLFDYFKDVSDYDFCRFVLRFSYEPSGGSIADSDSTGEVFFNKFLKDMGLASQWKDYLSDINDKSTDRFFYKTSSSYRSVVNDIHSVLGVLSFNRLKVVSFTKFLEQSKKQRVIEEKEFNTRIAKQNKKIEKIKQELEVLQDKIEKEEKNEQV